MAPFIRRPRLALTAGVALLAVINALALAGTEIARRGEVVLQVATGLGAAVCGVVVAARMRGAARWWRLLYVGALLIWAVAEMLWGPGCPARAVVGRCRLSRPTGVRTRVAGGAAQIQRRSPRPRAVRGDSR